MKISCVTSCKGRLGHLKRAMPLSLANSPEDVEFVVVDYDCPQGAAAWLMGRYPAEIKSGRILVVKVDDAPSFYNCHAANVGFLCASGDLICKLDADNYVREGFIEFVAENVHEGLIAIPDARRWGGERKPAPQAAGRLAIWKSHFVEIGGYNEDFVDWAWDDVEIVERSVRHGTTRILIPRALLKGMIRHNNAMRKAFLKNKEGTPIKGIWEAQKLIRDRSAAKNLLVANAGREWGRASVAINGGPERLIGSRRL